MVSKCIYKTRYKMSVLTRIHKVLRLGPFYDVQIYTLLLYSYHRKVVTYEMLTITDYRRHSPVILLIQRK